MKKLFALLFISMISGMIMAQIPEVSGTIVFKKDGQPVVGALVSVLGTDISTITDAVSYTHLDVYKRQVRKLHGQ